MAPLKKAGKSVQRMARRLNKLTPQGIGPQHRPHRGRYQGQRREPAAREEVRPRWWREGRPSLPAAQDDADGRDTVRGERRQLPRQL
eukprot:scaffold27767_cov69-Phaeocystis_antarctica.AAC.2